MMAPFGSSACFVNRTLPNLHSAGNAFRQPVSRRPRSFSCVRMSSARFSEFSLNSNPDPFCSVSSKDALPIDWHDWSLSGEQMEIPAIPFPPKDVFLPGEVKRLHLYEARFLELFNNVIKTYDGKCAHVLIDKDRKAIAAIGTVVRIKAWQRLKVGISVELEAIGRLKMERMKCSLPYLRGNFQVVNDDTDYQDMDKARLVEIENDLWSAFTKLVERSLKLKMHPRRKKVGLQSLLLKFVEHEGKVTKEQLRAAIKEESEMQLPEAPCVEMFVKEVREAASRLMDNEALNFTRDASKEEILMRMQALSFALCEYFPSKAAWKQKALEQRDTVARVKAVTEQLEQTAKMLEAKMSLQRAFVE